MGIEVEGLTLSNAAEGRGEEQFQEMVEKALDVFAEPEKWEAANDVICVKIPVEITLYWHTDSRTLSVGARAGLKIPKRREAIRAGFVKDGTVVVNKERQQDLFSEEGASVTPLRSEDRGGES